MQNQWRVRGIIDKCDNLSIYLIIISNFILFFAKKFLIEFWK